MGIIYMALIKIRDYKVLYMDKLINREINWQDMYASEKSHLLLSSAVFSLWGVSKKNMDRNI